MKSDWRFIVGSVVVAGLVALLAIFDLYSGDPAPIDKGNVRVVAAPSTKSTVPMQGSQLHRPISGPQAENPDELTTALLDRFPAIREANVVCDGGCKLVAALGDQTLGLSPLNGNLERFLVEQGYKLNGALVIDQPGDNDTLLTIPVSVTPIEDHSNRLPTNR